MGDIMEPMPPGTDFGCTKKKTDTQTVEEILTKLRPLLPIQNPMPFFVHNNPLMYWESFPFQEGLENAVLTYENNLENKTRRIWRDLEDFVIPLILSYLDQGLNRWISPSKKSSLWDWYCDYIQSTWSLKSAIIPTLKKSLPQFRKETSIEVIARVLRDSIPNTNNWETHLQTLIFHFKGWSGMIQVLEQNPALFPLKTYNITFLDWVAILVTSEQALKTHKGIFDEPLWDLAHRPRRQKSIRRQLSKIRAAELRFYHETMTHLKAQINSSKQSLSHQTDSSLATPLVQALFCIDDREESLRRYLETVNSRYETFGTVGFFGVDFSLRRFGHLIYQPQCPPVIKSRKRAEELSFIKNHSLLSRIKRWFPHLNESRFTPIEPFLALVCWPFYLVALWLRSFSPKSYSRMRDWLHRDHPLKTHHALKFAEPYTESEKTAIVAGILGGAGMANIQSLLVMILGHTATTTNNPFQKSYGCGACSGQSGFTNAKLFAEFANDPKVRALLPEYGIHINSDTLFLAGCHDTCSDQIFYAPITDTHLLETQRRLLEEFKDCMKRALELNTKERWNQFSLPGKETPEQRSLDWSQPRPEYGHTGVALSVFGPRWLTKNIDLKRRAFLISYDPHSDPDGKHLAFNILSALPVCANINLDYFTSASFPKAFGAGSKLPLNIASGIGLMPGSKGDLQIGLATQMVDQHLPLRLLAFVYAEAQHLENVIASSARLKNLINNNWVHLIRIDPSNLEFEALTGELKNEFSTL